MQGNQPDIIVFTLFRADNPYSSISIRLAKYWARGGRVFYINPPYTYKDLWAQRRNSAVRQRTAKAIVGTVQYESHPEIPDRFVSVIPPAFFPINWLSEGRIYDFAWKRVEQQIVQTLRQVIADYAIGEFIFFNCFNPYFLQSLPADMQPLLHIYHCIDDISQEPYTARHGKRLENIAVQRADLVTVTAHQLRRMYAGINPHIHILHNAVDMDTFSSQLAEIPPRPLEIQSITGKIIGFTGNLDHVRIDYPLLKKTALAHPDKTLVLVGPVNSRDIADLGINRLPNVVLTGSKPYEELPAFMQYFDCALIPFLCNQLTQSIYPLKINEYLAAGLPVVSTDFSEDIRSFSDHISLATDPEQFVLLIEEAVRDKDENRAAARKALALGNTWEARVEQFWELVDGYLTQ